MSVSTQDTKSTYDPRTVFNVPNQLTSIRLVLAIVLFGLIAYEQYLAGMWVFIVAAGTDWIDGFYARRYNQVTTLGRILDPFVDKIIICGTFIFLAAIPSVGPLQGSGLTPAMAVIVVGRELLVTALRSFLEQQGADFSATLSGKLKMVLQCIAAVTSLYALSYGTLVRPGWLQSTLTISVWAAVALTVVSGVAYVFAAIRLLRQ
jgi:CDP-diacylglycerol---glycerol-3-phosphate 3-phosphatidyltransferase